MLTVAGRINHPQAFDDMWAFAQFASTARFFMGDLWSLLKEWASANPRGDGSSA
jgi:hypothetical protein